MGSCHPVFHCHFYLQIVTIITLSNNTGKNKSRPLWHIIELCLWLKVHCYRPTISDDVYILHPQGPLSKKFVLPKGRHSMAAKWFNYFCLEDTSWGCPSSMNEENLCAAVDCTWFFTIHTAWGLPWTDHIIHTAWQAQRKTDVCSELL